MKKRLTLFITSILILSGCISPATQIVPTHPLATETLRATATLLPSSTPSTTATATPIPEQLGLPDGILPHGLGMSIHYEFIGDTYFPAAEYALLDEAHLGFVRDDLWPGGACDGVPRWCFEAFDKLVTTMSRMNIRVLFGLVGHNYEVSGSEESRKAFVVFAKAVAEHFKGRGVIYELWGEPDGDWSWHPKSNPQEYALLASETITAMKEVDPDAVILGPNVATLDTIYSDNSWKFLKAIGDLGVLTQFDAVNVHLHNGGIPETQIKNLLRLRRMIDFYSPDRKIPITSSEWGYTTGGEFYRFRATEEQQTQFMVRSWLVDISHEIYLNIWYDWKDDTWGQMEEYDRHFGVITGEGEPKPAYEAVKTLTTTLDGYEFVRRIVTDTNKDYLLLFRNKNDGMLVAWTTTAPHTLIIPNVTGNIESIDMLGTSGTLQSNEKGLALPVSASPQYLLLPEGSMGDEEIHWKPEGTFFRIDNKNHGEIPITIENPYDQEQTYELQASLNDATIGSLQVSVAPGKRITVILPMDILPKSNDVDFFVKVAISNHETTQTAWVWVQK